MSKISRRKFVAGAATIAVMYPFTGTAASKPQYSWVTPYDPLPVPQYWSELELISKANERKER